MAYFSSKSTWLSLIEGAEPAAATPYVAPLPPEDSHPHLFPAPGEGEAAEQSWDGVDVEGLRIAQGLRHRLFFQHREWEFGPALLRDNFRLARLQSNPEEALAYYGFARHVAQALVEEYGQAAFLPAWLEATRLISEIHRRMGNFESAATYARAGLDTLKKNKFDASLELHITKLSISFAKLLTQP